MDSKTLEVPDSKLNMSDDGLSISDMSDISAYGTTEGFQPSVQMQIETEGLYIDNFCRADASPIPIYGVSADGRVAASPTFVSVRPVAKSNSNALVYASGADAKQQQPVLMTTVYKAGLTKPRMRVLAEGNGLTPEQAVEEAKAKQAHHGGAEWEVSGSSNPMSRTRRMATPYGTFEWRYGSRSEKKNSTGGEAKADSLLVLERVNPASKKDRVRVAQLVRNAEFRTAGTSRWNSMGNGGRLQMDAARLWGAAGGEEDGAAKGAEPRQLQAFVVMGALMMLKREVDRQRGNQVVVVT